MLVHHPGCSCQYRGHRFGFARQKQATASSLASKPVSISMLYAPTGGCISVTRQRSQDLHCGGELGKHLVDAPEHGLVGEVGADDQFDRPVRHVPGRCGIDTQAGDLDNASPRDESNSIEADGHTLDDGPIVASCDRMGRESRCGTVSGDDFVAIGPVLGQHPAGIPDRRETAGRWWDHSADECEGVAVERKPLDRGRQLTGDMDGHSHIDEAVDEERANLPWVDLDQLEVDPGGRADTGDSRPEPAAVGGGQRTDAEHPEWLLVAGGERFQPALPPAEYLVAQGCQREAAAGEPDCPAMSISTFGRAAAAVVSPPSGKAETDDLAAERGLIDESSDRPWMPWLCLTSR